MKIVTLICAAYVTWFTAYVILPPIAQAVFSSAQYVTVDQVLDPGTSTAPQGQRWGHRHDD